MSDGPDEDEQVIRYRYSVDITRPDDETAKDISTEIQRVIAEHVDGVVSVRELGWRRLIGGVEPT